MNNVSTVSDTKRAFYSVHTRPIHALYRRVVEELMVEMHLLAVNSNFVYDPIYALGVVTAFDRFTGGYRPESDRESIFKGLCLALQSAPEQYRQDAQSLLAAVEHSSLDAIVTWLSGETGTAPSPLKETVDAIAQRSLFKYSRLFAIGLYTLMEAADAGFAKQKDEDRAELLSKIGGGLHLPKDKLQKDLETYERNLENMAQAKIVMEEAIQAERKKREKREQEKRDRAAAKAAAAGGDGPVDSPTQPS